MLWRINTPGKFIPIKQNGILAFLLSWGYFTSLSPKSEMNIICLDLTHWEVNWKELSVCTVLNRVLLMPDNPSDNIRNAVPRTGNCEGELSCCSAKRFSRTTVRWVIGARLIVARKLELHSGVCKQSDCSETRRAAASFRAVQHSPGRGAVLLV